MMPDTNTCHETHPSQENHTPSILVVGATSAMAQEAARIWAGRKARLYLVGRDEQRLEILAADLRVRGASEVRIARLNALDFERHHAVMEKAWHDMGGVDVALFAHGILPDQALCETNFDAAHESLRINFLSVVSMLTPLAGLMKARGKGTLAVIGSVAGLRGRQSNYVYGAAKGGLALWLQGVRNALARSGVRVVTILPGFVDTPMTADFPKGPLFAKADRVAAGIVKAIDKGSPVVYLPWFWRWIMVIIRLIPERIFMRLKL